MQTTKILFVIGVAALLAASSPTFAGPDNEAQAKMREALRQKMEELNAPAAPAPAPVAVEPAPTAPAPVPVVAPKPVVKTPTVVVPVPVEPAANETPAAPVAAPKSTANFSDVAVSSDDEKAARMREALRKNLTAAPAVATPAKPAAPAAPAKPVVTAAAPVHAPPAVVNVETPASPLTGSKQDRLAELLSRYKADVITPMEYHNQRAKIIAEP